jgi:two-component system, chemotaxis family, protein-glutamate methylesterase/glutaminase
MHSQQKAVVFMFETASWGVRVLLAEDSPTVRYHLTGMINETPGFQVIGIARNGEEAVTMVQELKPDVVSMDIKMPRMDGLEATRRIMAICPTPVVVVSGLLEQEIELSFLAMQAGALAVVEKPPDRNDPTFPDKQRHLIKTLMAMAGVRVIQRREMMYERSAELPIIEPGAPRPTTSRLRVSPEIIAIGASAGGPSALTSLLASFPADFPLPVVIVQHMPNEFIGGLARWLNKSTTLPVRVAIDGMMLQPGQVYLSPGSYHMTVNRTHGNLTAHMIREQGTYRYQPSVDVLLNSIAATCGAAGVGIVLTGMGDDGAEGLLAMRQAGARTFVQDETSSTVFGMPGAAIERGAAEQVLPLLKLATAIANLV